MPFACPEMFVPPNAYSPIPPLPVFSFLFISAQKENVWKQFAGTYTRHAVATPATKCSQMGEDVLSWGGNAIDAAITAALCVGVIYP